ncbi:hypothetical protein M3Y98_00578800 [Aphelenchoides besseyi]|nr:hypothetical protein M3Y98_00578800 [Aphelenchoides besseyi]KAI6193864.1 hypothetical protein M3Y96_01063900 [Aphelenchoides besseyi]
MNGRFVFALFQRVFTFYFDFLVGLPRPIGSTDDSNKAWQNQSKTFQQAESDRVKSEKEVPFEQGPKVLGTKTGTRETQKGLFDKPLLWGAGLGGLGVLYMVLKSVRK